MKDKWNPIETAPPGETVLLWVSNGYGHAHVKTGIAYPEAYPELKIVSVYDDGESLGYKSEEFASHWMPLPTPHGGSPVCQTCEGWGWCQPNQSDDGFKCPDCDGTSVHEAHVPNGEMSAPDEGEELLAKLLAAEEAELEAQIDVRMAEDALSAAEYRFTSLKRLWLNLTGEDWKETLKEKRFD